MKLHEMSRQKYNEYFEEEEDKKNGVKREIEFTEYLTEDTRKGQLKRHIESFHEKVKYPCPQCGNRFTFMSNLKKHIVAVHEKLG